MKLTNHSHLAWLGVTKSLTLAAAVAGLLIPIEAAAQGVPSHDANMASQHQSQSTAASAHDRAQTSQHNALSQKIDSLSTQGVDLSGLPPTWDKTLPANDPGGPCPASSSRFKCVMDGAAVLDRETGLVWEQSPRDAATNEWGGAQIVCNTRIVGNRLGWRLPTVQELGSLIDPSVRSPALPAGHPFSNVQQLTVYWSATTNSLDTSLAWAGEFRLGSVFTITKSEVSPLPVWCVRGSHGVDPQ